MPDNFEYITKQNQRWDQVAQEAYGQSTLIEGIIAANPIVPITDKLPAGTVLQIPVLDEVSVKTTTELLPPWKR